MESKSQRSRGPHLDQTGPGRWLSGRGWEVIFSGRKQVGVSPFPPNSGRSVFPLLGQGLGPSGKAIKNLLFGSLFSWHSRDRKMGN